MTRDSTTHEEKSSRSYWGFVLWPVVVIVLALGVVCTACSDKTQAELKVRPAGARLTTGEAIRIAQETATREGRKLSDYRQPEAHYEFVQTNKTWSVFFEGKARIPGNHFSVEIDDLTGNAQLWRGL